MSNDQAGTVKPTKYPVEGLAAELGWQNDDHFWREYHTNSYLHAVVEVLLQERRRSQSGWTA